MSPSVKVHWAARARAVRLLAAADAAGWVKEYSISAPVGGETRISFVLYDQRRDIDLPGIAIEDDEKWGEEDTDPSGCEHDG